MMKLSPTYIRPNTDFPAKRAVWTFCCLIGFCFLPGCGDNLSSTQPVDQGSVATETSPVSGTVTIEIAMDSEDASQTMTKTAEIRDDTTLATVMANLDDVEVVMSGSGVTAFVQSINGVETSADRGWTYTLDGKFATEGIGSTKLQPEQTVQWKFTTFEEAMK